MNSASGVSFGKFENIGKTDLRGGADISRAGVSRAGFCASSNLNPEPIVKDAMANIEDMSP